MHPQLLLVPEQLAAQAFGERLAEHPAERLAAQASAGSFDDNLAAHLAAYCSQHLADHKADELAVDRTPVCSAPPEHTLVVRKVAANAELQSVVSSAAVPALGERLTHSSDVAGPHSAQTPASRCNQAAHMAECVLFAAASGDLVTEGAAT